MTNWLAFFKQVDNVVWGAPLLILLVGTGIYLSFRLGLLQVFRLPQAFRLIFTEDQGEGDISSFGALATALAATVGTGNIVGVATAIQTGGRGGDGYQGRWPRSPLLDVDGSLLWDGDQVCRRFVGHSLPNQG